VLGLAAAQLVKGEGRLRRLASLGRFVVTLPELLVGVRLELVKRRQERPLRHGAVQASQAGRIDSQAFVD
jgi:hypothetical protein